eukprot:707185-Hanusia_phi.AAC.1
MRPLETSPTRFSSPCTFFSPAAVPPAPFCFAETPPAPLHSFSSPPLSSPSSSLPSLLLPLHSPPPPSCLLISLLLLLLTCANLFAGCLPLSSLTSPRACLPAAFADSRKDPAQTTRTEEAPRGSVLASSCLPAGDDLRSRGTGLRGRSGGDEDCRGGGGGGGGRRK